MHGSVSACAEAPPLRPRPLPRPALVLPPGPRCRALAKALQEPTAKVGGASGGGWVGLPVWVVVVGGTSWVGVWVGVGVEVGLPVYVMGGEGLPVLGLEWRRDFLFVWM